MAKANFAYQPLLFEELLPWFEIKGYIQVLEDTPPGGAPSKVIRTDQSWRVRFNWTTSGPLNYVMCGDWHLKLYLEQLGAKEFDLRNAEETVRFISKPHAYGAEITVPAHEVPAGLFELAAEITMTGQSGVPGPIAGSAKIERLHFFDGGPITSPVPYSETFSEAEIENGR